MKKLLLIGLAVSGLVLVPTHRSDAQATVLVPRTEGLSFRFPSGYHAYPTYLNYYPYGYYRHPYVHYYPYSYYSSAPHYSYSGHRTYHHHRPHHHNNR